MSIASERSLLATLLGSFCLAAACSAKADAPAADAIWVDIESHQQLAESMPQFASPETRDQTETVVISSLTCRTASDGLPELQFELSNPFEPFVALFAVAVEGDEVGSIIGFAIVRAPAGTSIARLEGSPPPSAAFELTDGRDGRSWGMSDTCTVIPSGTEGDVVFASTAHSADIS